MRKISFNVTPKSFNVTTPLIINLKNINSLKLEIKKSIKIRYQFDNTFQNSLN